MHNRQGTLVFQNTSRFTKYLSLIVKMWNNGEKNDMTKGRISERKLVRIGQLDKPDKLAGCPVIPSLLKHAERKVEPDKLPLV